MWNVFCCVGVLYIDISQQSGRASSVSPAVKPNFQLLSFTDVKIKAIQCKESRVSWESKTPDHIYLFVYSFYTQLKVIKVLL